MDFDLVVVGAGTAGSAAAAFAAERGLRVMLMDRGPLDRAGARWVNGVHCSLFEAVGLTPSEGDELRSAHHRFHMLAGWGPERIAVDDHGVWDVDMRHLTARLQDRARAAGALLEGEVEVHGLEGDVSASRTTAAVLTARGPVRARAVVDATGYRGARLLDQPDVPRRDLCAAAQEVRRLADRPAAVAFFERHGVDDGDTLCFTGIAGGYSIINLRLEPDAVSILTGSIPADGQPSGRQLVDRFAAEHSWVGEAVFGGQRVIPLGRPLDSLARGGVALLGDAGVQMFSAHGSGIAIGLRAAHLLATTLAAGGTPWDYNVAFQRRFGALLAGYDAFRRFSQRLEPDDTRALMRAGAFDAASAEAGLRQVFPSVGLLDAARKLRGVARAPHLGPALARTGARIAAAQALYRAYPARPEALPRWSRAAQAALD